MKKILVTILGIVMAISLCGCGGSSSDDSTAWDGNDTGEIITDKDAGTVSVYATVNGTYFDQSTMHYLVYQDGNAAKKAMLKSFVDPHDFCDAMLEIGGEPGNTTTDELEDGEFAKGQDVDVTLTWDGQDDPVDMIDTIKTKDGSKPDFNIVFSGNEKLIDTASSGCITCLNSCWAGITCNNALAFGAVDSGNPEIYLNDEVMPDDGTIVKVTFTLK